MSSALIGAILWLFLMTSYINGEICKKEICEFNLIIKYDRTLVYRSKSGKTYEVQLKNGQLQTVANTFHKLPNDEIGKNVSAENVITADGYKRSIITVNGQFPGPTLEVMEGSQIVVHVRNHLQTESISVHWHGIPQKLNPWMDGAAYITQCPIAPRQTFTYRFMASPAGTHWYHSHISNQRQDGLFGALIIHKREPEVAYVPVLLSDWFHELGSTFETSTPYHPDPADRGTGELMSDATKRGYSTDGIETTAVDFVSALINGRGRHKAEQKWPLSEFTIEKGKKLRMNIINAAGEFSFEFSIDNHKMTIIASDSQPLEPTTVDALIIHAGETYDIEVEGNQPSSRYWIRSATLREGFGNNNPEPDPNPDGIVQEARAILSYSSTDARSEPKTRQMSCTAETPCSVFNCPYTESPKKYDRRCTSVHEVKSTLDQQFLDYEYGVNHEDFDEYIFNIGFNWGSSINGRRFANPMESLTDRYVYGDKSGMVSCDTEQCENPEQGCICTNIMELPFNQTVQFVITNLRLPEQGHPEHLLMSHHPMHIHGHFFAVLHVGYPEYNKTTGRWKEANTDLLCESPVCKRPYWNRRPALNTVNPPIKDTINIPARSYAVIRFRTTNPGIWHMHCHADSHLLEGMNIIFHEAPGRYPPPPEDFPKCYHYSMSNKEFEEYQALSLKYYKEGKPNELFSAMFSPCCVWTNFESLLSLAVVIAIAGAIFTDVGRGLCLFPILFITTRCQRKQQKNGGYNLVKSQ